MSNNVTVDRDELAALLGYAECEIETRYSCLKDSGDERAALESEVSEGQETLAAFQAILTERPTTPHLRKPYYQAADGIADLQNALSDANLQKDSGLLVKITQLTG